jgi:hypothetical protein
MKTKKDKEGTKTTLTGVLTVIGGFIAHIVCLIVLNTSST